MTTLKYIREFSDCHLNCYFSAKTNLWEPVPYHTDDETALILAGDLWESDKFLMHSNKSWISELAKRFHSIIVIAGNHDYWGEEFYSYPVKIKKKIEELGLTNVYFLENDTINIDRTKFVGATLWTDFNKSDPFTVWQARQVMNDYKYIRSGPEYKKLMAEQLLAKHFKSREYIFTNAVKDEDTDKVIVVSHHSPSFLSLSDRYRGNGYHNGYYHSELGDLIVDSEIDYWYHGHVHNCNNYVIGNTNVVSNPVGYFPFEDTGYDTINRITL